MKTNRYATLNNLDVPFNPSSSKIGTIEYSTDKPYQHALYGFGITEPTFVGIPKRKICYQDLCVSKETSKPVDGSNKVFPEFDNGMLIYRHPR